MGNHSYLSKVDNSQILNPWHEHSLCELQFISEGIVVEKMRGIYSGYGSVLFEEEFSHHILKDGVWVDITRESVQNNSGVEWIYADWDTLVDFHFGDDKSSGFAAVYVTSMTSDVQLYTTRSNDDPDQGDVFPNWDEEEEDDTGWR